MSKLKIENPFRVTVFRRDTHWNCHSFKKRSEALNKLAEILPNYYNGRSSREYPFRLVLTHITYVKNKGVKCKKLLEVKP